MISFGSPNLEKDSKRVVEGNLRGHSPSQDVVFGDRITREPPYPPHTGSLTPSGRGSKGRERFLSCLHPGLLPGDFDHLLPALSWDSGLTAHVSDSARAAWCSVSKSFANCRGRVCFFLLAMKRKNFLVCPPLSLPQPILHKQNKINKHLYWSKIQEWAGRAVVLFWQGGHIAIFSQDNSNSRLTHAGLPVHLMETKAKEKKKSLKTPRIGSRKILFIYGKVITLFRRMLEIAEDFYYVFSQIIHYLRKSKFTKS